MYESLLIVHSLFRWLVVLSLGYSIYRAWLGRRTLLPFTKTDNALRHWTATIAHTQLLIGMVLYSQSPMVKYFNSGSGNMQGEPVFFGLIHILLMLVAVVIITVGSANAKRKTTDSDKFATMLTYFSIAAAIIFIAIPWPFSPLAHRPLIRF
jgi:hypothetical protein